MQQQSFFNMFIDVLRDIFDAENQIVTALPKLVQAAHHQELKDAFNQHLAETKSQVQRLKQIFKMLNENPTGVRCKAMQGLLEEGEESIKKDYTPNVKDACLIIAAQKVEHYEISSYGSACSLCNHLNNVEISDRIDFDEIFDLLQQNLEEEKAADEKLTDIADGGFFTQGINDEAEKEAQTTKQSQSKTRSSSKNY
jgi:ferritin-like metal-binding protein YciE